MDEFDEDPLDLLEDDGDGVIEMPLFFDEDSKNKQGERPPASHSGCCVLLLGLITSLLIFGWGATRLIV